MVSRITANMICSEFILNILGRVDLLLDADVQDVTKRCIQLCSQCSSIQRGNWCRSRCGSAYHRRAARQIAGLDHTLCRVDTKRAGIADHGTSEHFGDVLTGCTETHFLAAIKRAFAVLPCALAPRRCRCYCDVTCRFVCTYV